jgi:uncharacterized protein YyaL (SSP411 family)
LTGDERYTERAHDILRLLRDPMGRQPSAFSHLLEAVDLATAGITEIAIPGTERRDLVEAVQRRYLPNAVLAWGERYSTPLFDERTEGMAYVCRNYACQQPTDDVGGLIAQLGNPPEPPSPLPAPAVDDLP